jgi:dTDP-4-amino-4,6-dideoxygalactose transaminase
VLTVPFNVPDLSSLEIKLLTDAISGSVTSGNGPFCKQAESLLEYELNTQRALLTTSCTHALELCALLSGMNRGDEIIVPSYTFVSTASAFLINGMKPVFVDVEEGNLNLDPILAEKAITPKTKAICVVHYGGIPANLNALVALAEHYGLLLIEDNAHGLFSKYFGRYTGTFGTFATQSFHETKNIICGEGGALLINDPQYVNRAEILREKGTNRSAFLRGQVDKYSWVDVGSSWVLSDLLGALLFGQLSRAGQINSRRLFLYDRYLNELSPWAEKFNVRIPAPTEDIEHTGHLFHLRFENLELRTSFIQHLKDRGVSSVFHYQALNTSEIGKSIGGFQGQCPVSENASDCLARLPIYSLLSDEQQTYVIEVVKSFIG